ncbi:MAG: hypothetical protein AAGE43_04355 [Pseudomonadota bacterium]
MTIRTILGALALLIMLFTSASALAGSAYEKEWTLTNDYCNDPLKSLHDTGTKLKLSRFLGLFRSLKLDGGTARFSVRNWSTSIVFVRMRTDHDHCIKIQRTRIDSKPAVEVFLKGLDLEAGQKCNADLFPLQWEQDTRDGTCGDSHHGGWQAF